MIISIFDFLIEEGGSGSLIRFQRRLEKNKVYFTVELEWMPKKILQAHSIFLLFTPSVLFPCFFLVQRGVRKRFLPTELALSVHLLKLRKTEFYLV